jgi:hypothetical protein
MRNITRLYPNSASDISSDSPGGNLLKGYEVEIIHNTIHSLEDKDYKDALEKYIKYLETEYRKHNKHD